MRITTQMLNEATQKSGLQVQRRTLLDYVNNKNAGNSLFQALSASRTNSSNASKLSTYEKLESSADKLLQQVTSFIADDEESIFDKIEKDGKEEDKETLYDSIDSMIESYNAIMNSLKTSTGTLDSYYRKMMKEVAAENEEALADIGISVERDGSMSLNMDKLKACDIATVKDVLGESGTFSTKIGLLAAHISDNAEANVESLSSQYNSLGSTYSASSSKYNFLS